MGTLAEATAPSTRSTGPADVPGAGVRASDSTIVPSSVTKRRVPARRAVTARRSCRPGRRDEGGVDGPHALVAAEAQRVRQGVEVEDRAAARAQLPADAGKAEDGAGAEAQDVALAPAAGPPRLASLPTVGFARRGHDVAAHEHRGRREGKRRSGALGDLLVDLAAQSGAVERGEPGLLAEDMAGVRPGEYVGLNLVDPLRELGERAGLRQHGGGDGTGGGRGDDVGHDPLDADQVLQDADLEGALGASSGEDERGAAGAGIRGHQVILAPRAQARQRCSTTRGSAHHLDQGPGTGGRGGPLRARDDTAVHGDGHTSCTLVLDELRHEVGDRGAAAPPAPARR